MNSTLRLYLTGVLGLVGVLAFGPTSSARAAHIYTITQNQSQLNLTVTGSAFGGALTVTEQHPTAVTRYNGTIAADFPGGPAVGGSIEFPGGGEAAAVNPVLVIVPLQFTPNVNGGSGTAAANYGVNLTAPINIDLPPISIPDVIDIDLGILQSVSLSMAIRELKLDIDSGPTSIGAGGTFDANSTSLSVASGFADLNGALVFDQPGLLETLAVSTALGALALAFPDLGLTVTPNLINSSVALGLGTRFDLAGLGALSLPNGATTDGTVTYNPVSGNSVLTLPALFNLPGLGDFGIPAEILDLQLSLSGQLRATAVVPEPSSIVLAVCGALGLIGFVRRKR